MNAVEIPTLPFKTQAAFRAWLIKNHDKSPGVWVKFFKKDSKVTSIVYKEALDEALCFGWIDSQSKSLGAESYVQKFTPRKAQSMWSKINREKVARLIEEKKMTTAGLAQIEAAKKDGRWDRAYDSSATATVPEDFMRELMSNNKAKKFWDTLNRANTYAFIFRITTAKKAETRERRIAQFIAMLEQGKKFH